MAAPPTHDSAASPCFQWLPGSPPRAFPTIMSSLTSLGLPPHSQHRTLPSDCSKIPLLKLPVSVPSRGPAFLPRVHIAVARIICVILIPFRLSQDSCFTFSPKCFSSDQNNGPNMGLDPPKVGPVLLTLLFLLLIPSTY